MRRSRILALSPLLLSLAPTTALGTTVPLPTITLPVTSETCIIDSSCQNATITPTLGSSVSSVSISPNLTNQTGLAFNSATGAISGTPTALQPATTYTLTAVNSAGKKATATVQIAVFAIPPTISLATTAWSFLEGMKIEDIVPTLGPSVKSVSISPDITSTTGVTGGPPSGLTFNSNTGKISGTPTFTAPPTTYTLTAASATNVTNPILQTASVQLNVGFNVLVAAVAPPPSTAPGCEYTLNISDFQSINPGVTAPAAVYAGGAQVFPGPDGFYHVPLTDAEYNVIVDTNDLTQTPWGAWVVQRSAKSFQAGNYGHQTDGGATGYVSYLTAETLNCPVTSLKNGGDGFEVGGDGNAAYQMGLAGQDQYALVGNTIFAESTTTTDGDLYTVKFLASQYTPPCTGLPPAGNCETVTLGDDPQLSQNANGDALTPQIGATAAGAYTCNGNGVFAFPLATPGEFTTLVPASGITACGGAVADSNNAYWLDLGRGTVNSVPVGGGAATVLATDIGGSLNALAVDSQNVYWTDPGLGTIGAVPIGGGAATVLASDPNYPTWIATSAGYVFWVDNAGYPAGQIMAVPVTGGTPVTLSTQGYTVQYLASDSQNVYWSNTNSGTISSVPIGGGPTTVIASGVSSPRMVASDGVYVYFTNFATVSKVPVGGGQPVTLAVTPPTGGYFGTEAVGVFGGNVYWTDPGASVVSVTIPEGGPAPAPATQAPCDASVLAAMPGCTAGRCQASTSAPATDTSAAATFDNELVACTACGGGYFLANGACQVDLPAICIAPLAPASSLAAGVCLGAVSGSTSTTVSSTPVAVYPIGSTSDNNTPAGIASDGTNMWIVDTYGQNSVWVVNANGAIVGNYPVDPNSLAIAFDGTNMWVPSTGNNDVVELAPDGTYLGSFPVGSYPTAIAFDGTNMWVSNSQDNTVTELAPSGTAIGTYPVGQGPGALAFDGTNMWVTNGNETTAYVLSPTGVVLQVVQLQGFPQGIAFDGTNMWIVTEDANGVVQTGVQQVSLGGATVATTPLQDGPYHIAFDGTNMWIVNADNTVEVLGPSGTTVATLSSPNYSSLNSPYGLAWSGTGMWVSSFDGAFVTEF